MVVNALKVASVREDLHFKFCLIIVNLNSHSALAATVLDNTGWAGTGFFDFY